MKSILGKWNVGIVAIILLVAFSVAAQDYSGRIINEIKIEGLDRISDSVARARIEIQAGSVYDASATARDIRRLHEMGYFETVAAELREAGSKVDVVYVIAEKRVIDEVRIIGNRKVRTRNIRGALTMREGGAFVPELFEEERQAILELYQEKGFANTSIDVTAENMGQSRVRLVYDINEGVKARIRSITFVGNDKMGRRKLRKTVKTKASRWFWGGRYEEGKFEADLKNIIDKYGNHGMLDANVTATDMEFSKNGKRIDITVYIEEGAEYSVESMDIVRNMVFDDDEIMEAIEVTSGDIHDKGQVLEDAGTIEQGYLDSGYIDAVVMPQVTLDRDKKTTAVVYHIEEGELKYVREIRVTGNDITKDEIVRRQMLLIPGERYDGTAVKESEKRIHNTRFFDSARITLDDIDDDLFTDLQVNLEEGKTSVFNFGAGYSTEDKMGVYTELRLSNFDLFNWPKFSGAGQQLRLRAQIGQRRTEYDIGFTEPEFLGYPVSFGFDVFDESHTIRGAANYREKISGGQLRLGKALSPYVFAQTSLRYQETDLSEFPWRIHREIRRQAGESTIVSNRWQIERNTLDSNFDTNSGMVHLLAAEVAGLGGDHEFLRFEQDSTMYFPLGSTRTYVLSLRARHGVMGEYGSSDFVPLQERFYAGGTDTVRGYKNRDIGPKVREYPLRWWSDDFAVGGNMRFLYNFEVKYRVTDIFRLYGFADAGAVWADAGDFDFGDFNYSVGIGLGVNVPMLGPVRVDYGYPLNPDESQSSSGRLHMSTGLRF
ncbi:MAG: outer membrane protein assembly factor BamA [Candidatus Hydrogenedentes bacterium]|nr:outer membrane protein assembly factor BamA [Candidatus Hydrogenedentota bacterium]